MGVGHSRAISIICSPCIFENFMIFGHSQGFIKNCSPWLSSLWAQMVLSEDMFSFRMETRGEQIIENACLYPITFKYIENHGELILKKCLLCPTPEYLWGTIMKNPLLCPNAHAKLVPIKWTRLLQFCPIRSWLHPVLGHWIAPINFWLHPVLNNGLHQ